MADGDQVVSWVVSGRVQGVGFRWHTARVAKQLGVRGWVRNNQKGQVEVLGVADRNVLDEFEKQLWIGPSLSRVDNVDKISKQLDVSNIKSFDII